MVLQPTPAVRPPPGGLSFCPEPAAAMTAQPTTAPDLRIAQPLTTSHAQPDDTLALKRALNRLGLFVPDRRLGMNAYAGTDLFDALDRFRRNNGLPTGAPLRPDDPAIGVLNAALAAWPGGRRYVWRTVGDDRVRPVHAALEGRSFTWAAPPAEGHPGTAPGCRCWAEPVGPVCHTGPWLEDAYAFVESHEGFREYPYADPNEFLTTGYGFLIDSEEAFKAYPFRLDSQTGPLATDAQKLEGYEALRKFIEDKRLERGLVGKKEKLRLPATYYKPVTRLRANEAEATVRFHATVRSFVSELRRIFPDFDCFPTPAKIALTDMIYQIGGSKFEAGRWPKLFAAVRSRNWLEAGRESNRPDAQPDRNAKTLAKFKEAQSLEP